ncbi:hypothetical protein AJ79_00600 [Helicocarpus griseus UAMH5409]|uniref:SAC3/GANP/THP3 conserved domain-containing protein n=1 Tax=Helicocarpus griseus UAMH5409 TaxID=1447875 RepID=A0A2B7YB26_9EURO|nr:hypothetical protein AJ79_00600 [Helicocarpus griseus UAMH5409]
MSAATRGSALLAPGGPSVRGRAWRGGATGGSRPSASTDDSTRGAKTRAAGRGGPRGSRGRRGDISGGTAQPNGTLNKPSGGPFRGADRKNTQDGGRSRGQANGVKPQGFVSRPTSAQTSRPCSPFGAIPNTDGSSVDRSRDPRRRHEKSAPGGIAKKPMPQDYNSRYEQLKLDRARQRTEAIKTGQMADPNQPMTLTSAITPTGTCTEMCPEFERVERIVQKMVDKSEKITDSETGVSQIAENKMLKRFRRSAAGYDEQLPSDIRTPKTLLQTMNYLLRHVIEDDETLAVTHKFLWDRTRSIRNDLSIQQLTQAQDVQIAVKCLERIARFHIVSLHLLSSPENSEPFDHHQEREQLNNTLLSLLYYYDDNRDLIKFPHEDEFRAYYIVFSIHDQRPDLEARVQKWPRELLQSPRVQVALELFAAAGNTWEYQGTLDAKRPNAIAQGFYSRFFRLVQSDSVPYLLACIAEIYFNQVRQTAIRSIWKAYCRHPLSQQSKNQEWTVDDLTDALAFDDNDQTIEFCEEQDLQFATNAEGQMYLNWGQRQLDSVAFQPSSQQTFSYEFVESKRCGRTLVALILGMNVVQSARRGMIDESLLQSDSASQQDAKQNADADGLFVSDDEGQGQTSKQPKEPTTATSIFGKPTFSFPSVEDPGPFSDKPAGGSLFSGATTQQTSFPSPGSKLSPAAPVFTSQIQSPSPFTGFGKPSSFGAPQQQADKPSPAPQQSTGFGGFGQPSKSPFSPSQSAPQPTQPAFSSSFKSNQGSSLGFGSGSTFGPKEDTPKPQPGTSAPTDSPFKTSTPSFTFGQPSSSQLGSSNSSQGASQPASTPFPSLFQPKDSTTTDKPPETENAKPRESLFRPFPSGQPAGKQPSIFDKGTTPSQFPGPGTFGQPSKDSTSGQASNAGSISSMFSAGPAAQSSAQSQPTTDGTSTSAPNIFSSPFQSSAAATPKFDFKGTFNKPQEKNGEVGGQKSAEQKAADDRKAEQEAAEREAAKKKKEAEEAEAKRLEEEKREAARREIERERERRRAAAEEAARLERLENAKKEEELLRAKRLEEEKRKAAEREAALREMARQQEEELRASQLEITRIEAREREAAREETARREQIERDIAKRKAEFIEEDEAAKEQYRASIRESEGPLTVEDLLRASTSSRPKSPPPPQPPARRPAEPVIDEDELLLSAARMTANTFASGKHLWHDIPELRQSMSMSMSPSSTPRFSRSSIGPDTSKTAKGSHALVNGYDVALAPHTPLGLGRTLSRTEQRIRLTGAKGLASLPIASASGSSKLSNGKVKKNKHKRQKREGGD